MFIIHAEIRKKKGKSASRRLIFNEKIPAIIYGCKEKPISIEIFKDEIIKLHNKEEFYRDILIIVINEKTEYKVKVKEIQHHPFKNKIIHIDFIIK